MTLFTFGFKIRLRQLDHKWTTKMHHCLHPCLSCISEASGWPLVFRFHYCRHHFYCSVLVRDTSARVSVYTTKDVLKRIPDHIDKWSEWTRLVSRLHLYLAMSTCDLTTQHAFYNQLSPGPMRAKCYTQHRWRFGHILSSRFLERILGTASLTHVHPFRLNLY